MKKNIITLIAVVLGAISVVIALYIFSIQKVLFSKNGFNRSFIANNIQLKHKYF